MSRNFCYCKLCVATRAQLMFIKNTHVNYRFFATEANPNDEKTKTVSFEDVYPFTGYNPYLLSIVKNMPSKGRAEAVVDSYVRDYMCGNLSVFDNNEVLSTYLQTQELQDTLEFSYYACRCAQLTDKFDKTWLAKHYLAVVETRNTETVEIVPDQVDSSTIEQIKMTLRQLNKVRMTL